MLHDDDSSNRVLCPSESTETAPSSIRRHATTPLQRHDHVALSLDHGGYDALDVVFSTHHVVDLPFRGRHSFRWSEVVAPAP